MDITHIIAFNLALLAALVSPGPAMICAMQASLSHGRAAGTKVGLGLATIASVWVVLALFGFDVLFEIYPWLYFGAKIVGGAYLIYIAFMMWKHASDGLHQESRVIRRPFVHGALINLLNPKSVLFGAAMLVVIFPPGMSLPQILFVGANQLVVESMFYAFIAFGFSTRTMAGGYLRAKKYIDRMAAMIIGILGLRLIWSR